MRRRLEIVRRKLDELVVPLAEENWLEAERQVRDALLVLLFLFYG